MTAPTCTEAGYTTYTCAGCGQSYVSDETAALGHDYAAAVTNPTCTEAGYTTHTCARCGDSYTDAEVPALGHSFGEWVTVTAAACTAGGEQTRTCARCGEKETKTLDALGHDYVSAVTAPTCTEAGCTTYTCSRCGDSYVGDEVASLGHEYQDGVCTRCGADDPDYVPPIDRAALRAAIAAAEALDTSGYTAASVAALESALTAARAALDADTQAAVDAAAATLDGAVKGLEPQPAGEFRFDDVKDPAKFYFGPVYWAYNHEPQITKGTSEKLFSPDDGCTRAQVVTFLWRALGEPESMKTENPFEDVKEGQYYYKAVLWAVENGVTTGTSATTFRPERTCTRGQIVTFLWRALNEPEPTKTEDPFTDVKADQYYYKAVLWAVENGVTKGTGEGRFSPDATCTRGQIVTFLHRALTE